MSWSVSGMLMLSVIAAVTAYNDPYGYGQPTYEVHETTYYEEVPAPPSYATKVETVCYCPKIAGLESHCRPTKDCSVWYDDILATAETACRLNDGSPGACCPDIPYNYKGTPFIEPAHCVNPEIELDSHVGCLDLASVNAAIDAGEFELRLHKETADRLQQQNIVVQAGSARSTHARFSMASEQTRNISTEAFVGVHTAVVLVKRFKIKKDQVACALDRFKLSDTDLTKKCTIIDDTNCDAEDLLSAFRKIDGSCNNVKNFVWGRSTTQYHRMLESNYDDGIWSSRKSTVGTELPSARLVSVALIHDVDQPSEATTIWFMQYGQFLDHDMVATPELANADDTPVTCCSPEGKHLEDEDRNHGKCMAIDIPVDDPFFQSFGRTCMPFIRASLACRTDGKLGHAAQLNGNTHFLDLSLVYGSDDKTAGQLRTNENGQMNVTATQGKGLQRFHLLPPTEASPLQAPCTLPKDVSGIDPPADVKCFKAGDGRPDVTPNMAASQILFLREHNRLATELSKLNPYWDDERLYQEARRILIAQSQHITYNEWLPILLGRSKMSQIGLLPLQAGFSSDYDAELNPSILNEFVGAAFRFGHSLVQGKAQMMSQTRSVDKELLLRQHYFKPQELYMPGNLEKFLIGLSTQATQKVDPYFTKEMTNHLFEETGSGFGLDIVALNIQRGRDLGLQSYNSYRELCGIKRAVDFDDLIDLIDANLISRFKDVYNTVDDIDLFIGGISETKVEGSYVGPTFQCIMADQFLKLKRGDRHFYDLGEQPNSFTEAQLNEIRKTSLSRMICENSDVYEIQPMAFKIPNLNINPVVSCKSASIPRMDLTPWQEAPKTKNYGGYY